jgi:hypothetical protein
MTEQLDMAPQPASFRDSCCIELRWVGEQGAGSRSSRRTTPACSGVSPSAPRHESRVSPVRCRAPADMMRSILRGVAAGAAGTTALHGLTYLDMVLRGRPASQTPEQSVTRLADLADVTIPAEGRENRVSGAGALLGILSGLVMGAGYGAVRAAGWRPSATTACAVATVGAIAVSALPMAAIGVSNPRDWSLSDWMSDVVPHIAYGWVTTATYAAMLGRHEDG